MTTPSHTAARIVPCIWFDDQAEQAAAFYVRTFPHSRLGTVARYPATADNPIGKPRGSVAMVGFDLAGHPFTTLNGGPEFRPNPSVSFFVYMPTPEAVDSLFAALADGGQVLMPLGAYPWSERYSWVQDRFGVCWQLMASNDVDRDMTIVPCLMFTGSQHGRAGEAMRFYTEALPEGRIDRIELYGETEGPAGTVKHGRFVIAGQPFVAMDSDFDHGFAFSEGLSFQVLCENQTDLDATWDVLSSGGETGPCGWLKDRFGLSWQVNPAHLPAWISGGGAASERVLQTVWRQAKLDVAALEAAFQGPSG